MTCSGCGAALDPQAEICPYCRVPTAQAANIRAQKDAAARYQAQQQWAYQQVGKLSAHGEAQKLGSSAILWALVGLVPCFFLIPNIASIVFAVKAHGAAKRAGGSMPGTAIGAICISSLWIVLLPVAMVMGQIDENKRAERVKAIDEELSGELDGATLDLDTVCLLTEKQVIEEGFSDRTNVKKVDCAPAKLIKTPEGLEAEGVRVTFATGDPAVIRVCMKKGSRWSVDVLRPVADACLAPVASASATASSRDSVSTGAATATAAPTDASTGAAPTAAPTSRSGRR